MPELAARPLSPLAPPGPRALLPAAANSPREHGERVTLGDLGQEASRGRQGPPLAEVRWYRATVPRPARPPARLLQVTPGDALVRLAEPSSRPRATAVHAGVQAYRRTMERAAA